MLCIVSIEILAVVYPFLKDINNYGSFIYRSNSYSGLTGNVNIAAFSILMKLPLAIYKAVNSKKTLFVIFNLLIIVTGIYSIFSILSTRGAILGILLISLLFLLYSISLFLKKHITAKTLLKSISIIMFPLIFNVLMNSYQSKFSSESQSDVTERLETVTDFKNESNNQRLRYWKQSVMTGISSPILGIGIGNWKLKGIETDTPNLVNYIVPYHSHNDFFEFFAETGILGALFYLAFLFFTFIALIYFLKTRDNPPTVIFYLILVFTIYLMDSSLNFPFARPILQMSYLSIMIFSIVILKSEFGFDDSFKPLKSRFLLNVFWGGLILMAPFSLYSSAKIFNSSTQQFIMLGQFNLNLLNAPLSEVDTWEMDYPNISETTIPLKTLKGIYNLKNGNIEKAIDLFHKGRKANPYLMINESFLGLAFFQLNKKDSSLYYSKKAFMTVGILF